MRLLKTDRSQIGPMLRMLLKLIMWNITMIYFVYHTLKYNASCVLYLCDFFYTTSSSSSLNSVWFIEMLLRAVPPRLLLAVLGDPSEKHWRCQHAQRWYSLLQDVHLIATIVKPEPVWYVSCAIIFRSCATLASNLMIKKNTKDRKNIVRCTHNFVKLQSFRAT